MTEAIQSVSPRKREGTRAPPPRTGLTLGRRYHAPDPFRDKLALLRDELPAHERREGERPLHPLEGRPPTLVPAPPRGHGLEPARGHHDEGPLPPHRDLALVHPPDPRG